MKSTPKAPKNIPSSSHNYPDLKEISSFLPGNFFWKDAQGYYLGCSASFLKELNFKSFENVIGKTDKELWPSQAMELQANDSQVLQTKKPLCVEEAVTLNLEKKYFIVLKLPICDAKGAVIGIIGNAIPIDEIKNSQFALKAEKEKAEKDNKTANQYIKNVLASIPGSVYLKSKDGIYLDCNEFMVKTAGLFSTASIIGKSDYDLWPDQAEMLRENDQKVMDSGEPLRMEEVVELPNGEKRYFAAVKMPLRDENNQIIGIVGNSLDITELKATQLALKEAKEQAEVANKLKSEFMQNMQHDMRTPAAGLFNLFEFIRKSTSQEEFLELLSLGEDATKELLSLCDTLVDFETINYGGSLITKKVLSLENIIQRVSNLNAAALKEKKLKLTIDFADNIPKFVQGDDFRLQKIFTNLIGNSIKFTKKGGITVIAKLSSLKKEQVIIEFKIIDTGIGIPEDKKDLIFEKFIRLNPSNQGLYKGSGLGLSIVKKCIEELGGEIHVESEVNKGTTFYVTIPFEKVTNEQEEAAASISNSEIHEKVKNLQKNEIFDITSTAIIQEEKEQLDEKDTQLLSVLLIEDDKLALMGAKAALNSANCKITAAENVHDAKVCLDAHAYDLVISDIGLPDGTGFDIIMYVKSNPKHKNIATPFFALTAHTGDEIKQKASTSGFAHLFHKPITPQRVHTILDIYLEEKSEKSSLQLEQNNEDEPIIDLELSRQLSGGNEEVAYELLDLLIRTTPVELKLLDQFIKSKDSKSAREVLHKIKGGLSYCGVPRFKHALENLHVKIKTTKDVSVWKNDFKEIMNEWNHLVQAYTKIKPH